MIKPVQKKAQRVSIRVSSLKSLRNIIASGDFDAALDAVDCMLDLDFRKRQNEKITTLLHRRAGCAKSNEDLANKLTDEINEALKLIL